MIHLQDEDVIIYETPDVLDDADDNGVVVEESTEFIDREDIPRNEAFEAFVTKREFAVGDELDAKIAAIQSEIEALRLESSDKRLNTLASELKGIADACKPAIAVDRSEAEVHKAEVLGAEVLDAVHGDGALHLSRQELKRLASLESRLASIESRVGYSALPVSLVSAINGTQEKLDILTSDQGQVETAVRNLKTLNDFLTRTPVSNKVARLHESLTNLDPVIHSLPILVSRLKSLETLHTESAFCQSTVKELDATLRAMKTDIDRWTGVLDELEPKVLAAVETTAKNVEAAKSYT